MELWGRQRWVHELAYSRKNLSSTFRCHHQVPLSYELDYYIFCEILLNTCQSSWKTIYSLIPGLGHYDSALDPAQFQKHRGYGVWIPDWQRRLAFQDECFSILFVRLTWELTDKRLPEQRNTKYFNLSIYQDPNHLRKDILTSLKSSLQNAETQ